MLALGLLRAGDIGARTGGGGRERGRCRERFQLRKAQGRAWREELQRPWSRKELVGLERNGWGFIWAKG